MQKNKSLKILFISRAYPPTIGGIENQNYEISQWLSKISTVKTIANPYGKKFFPIFFLIALFKSLKLMRSYDVLLLGDGTLALLGWIIKKVYHKPVVSIVHGLDITYPFFLYQKLWVKFFLPKLDKLIAVGKETIRQGVKKGIPEEKFIFIPNGVVTEKFQGDYSRNDLNRITNLNLSGKKIILTLGRLAKRKGVVWFIENVMPDLDNDVIYLIAGDGQEKEKIKEVIKKNDLQDKVKLFTQFNDEERKILYNTADLFVQPNIQVTGDMEGFGLVVLEAGSAQRVVIASEIEGLQDAIQNGKNGFLVESANKERWIKKIEAILKDDSFREIFGQRASEYVNKNYHWKEISQKYLSALNSLVS